MTATARRCSQLWGDKFSVVVGSLVVRMSVIATNHRESNREMTATIFRVREYENMPRKDVNVCRLIKSIPEANETIKRFADENFDCCKNWQLTVVFDSS